MDVVWTSEFAANGIVDRCPDGAVDTSLYMPATLKSATYFNKLYAYPDTSDGGLLYYRKDLLEEAGLEVPKTWTELKAACDKIKAGQRQRQAQLLRRTARQVRGRHGELRRDGQQRRRVIIGDDGKPASTRPRPRRVWTGCKRGSRTAPSLRVQSRGRKRRPAGIPGRFADLPSQLAGGCIPGRQKTHHRRSKGKFDVAPLPGEDGPGVSSLGGHNVAIAKYGKNKGTAVEFAKW